MESSISPSKSFSVASEYSSQTLCNLSYACFLVTCFSSQRLKIIEVLTMYSFRFSYKTSFCRLSIQLFIKITRLAGLEPATCGLEGRYSIQLSYRRLNSPSRTRTYDVSVNSRLFYQLNYRG